MIQPIPHRSEIDQLSDNQPRRKNAALAARYQVSSESISEEVTGYLGRLRERNLLELVEKSK